jgi:hypothetical protein
MDCKDDKTKTVSLSIEESKSETIHHRRRHTVFEDQRRVEESEDLRIRLHHQSSI